MNASLFVEGGAPVGLRCFQDNCVVLHGCPAVLMLYTDALQLWQATRKVVRNAKLHNGDWQQEEADGGYPFIGCGEVAYRSTAIQLSCQSVGGLAAGCLM